MSRHCKDILPIKKDSVLAAYIENLHEKSIEEQE